MMQGISGRALSQRHFLMVILTLAITLLAFMPAFAHEQDEICGAGSDMDPQLCRALSNINSSTPNESALTSEEIGRSMFDTFVFYIEVGIAHIIPLGLDHILFIAAIAIGARRWQSLLLQVSAFTLAHTVTLGLAAAGVVNAPASVVEPLIALSIAFVAIENIFFPSEGRVRLAIIFGFGLLHGLGFAGVFADYGFAADVFWPSLIGFNLGVEVGQLIVVTATLLAAFLVRRGLKLAGQEAVAWRATVWPVSIFIAATGLLWTYQRVMGG